jgi:quinol monooxygenase YgiN
MKPDGAQSGANSREVLHGRVEVGSAVAAAQPRTSSPSEAIPFRWRSNEESTVAKMTCLLEISFRLLPAKRREFAQSLLMLTGSKDKRGSSSVVYEERDDLDHLLWVEEWADRSLLEQHLETDVFKTLMGALRTLATVEDCRIVDLGSSLHSGHVPGYKPRQLEGRRIPNDSGTPKAS